MSDRRNELFLLKQLVDQLALRDQRSSTPSAQSDTPDWQDGDDDALTPKEAGDYDHISLATLWRRVADGTYPKPFYPSPRTPRWRRGDLRRRREANRRLPQEAKELRRKAKLARLRVAAS